MNKKYKLMVFLFLVMCIFLSGCGSTKVLSPTHTPTATLTPTPKPINDEEFAEAAREVCSSLKTEIDSLNKFILFDLTSKAEAYRKAADALAYLDITEQSAPLGIYFLSSINDLASSFDIVGKALSEAIAKASLDESNISLAVTGDGTVYGSTGSIFESKKLEVDPTMIKELLQLIEQVNEAAISLNLEDCAIEN